MNPRWGFMFRVNNYCNLHCELCSAFPDGQIEPKWELPLNDVKLFCERLGEFGRTGRHVLTGGEPTALPIEHFEGIIEILKNNDRNVGVLTNGYNLMGVSKRCLQKIDEILFDDHGINADHVHDCIEYLKTFYKGNIRKKTRRYHWDFEKQRQHPSNKGKRCNYLITTMLLYKNGVLYPCCTLSAIGGYNRNTIISEELTKAGWNLCNPDLVEVIKDYRKTIPKYVSDQCLNHCWHPNCTERRNKVKITLKQNDVIKKV